MSVDSAATGDTVLVGDNLSEDQKDEINSYEEANQRFPFHPTRPINPFDDDPERAVRFADALKDIEEENECKAILQGRKRWLDGPDKLRAMNELDAYHKCHDDILFKRAKKKPKTPQSASGDSQYRQRYDGERIPFLLEIDSSTDS